VSIEIRPCASLEELRGGLNAIEHYFGAASDAEGAERFAQWTELERVHVALDRGRVVGGAGSFGFRLSVPGGDVDAAGVTVVGVLPSHRRRGVLTGLMRGQLADLARRGEPVAVLWASEGTIYGRFGYGLASRVGKAVIDRDQVAFARAFTPRGTVRLVDADEAAELFPPLYERVRAERPGMFSRTDTWWRTRRLRDSPESRRGSGVMNHALLELDGEPAAYALYRVKQEWHTSGFSTGVVTILEAVAPTPESTRELWRWLLDFDWTSQFVADFLPLDHPLFLLLAEPRRTRFQLGDGLWVRLVDVGAALSGRAYAGDGAVVFEVRDEVCPWNEGRWLVEGGEAKRTDAEADIALDVSALGSAYLGAVSFGELQSALRLEELKEGAVERADALFGWRPLPWCPEIF